MHQPHLGSDDGMFDEHCTRLDLTNPNQLDKTSLQQLCDGNSVGTNHIFVRENVGVMYMTKESHIQLLDYVVAPLTLCNTILNRVLSPFGL